MKEIYSIKDLHTPSSIKDVDGKKGIVTGYFAHFGNVDSDGDIIKQGAFTKSIAETGPGSAQPRIKHLMNHDVSQPLGVILSLSEDSSGLAYESQIGTHSLGMDFIKMVESGLITEHSIGFKTIKRNQLNDYEDYMKNPSQGMYELTELQLWEGSSLTAWGANSLTPLTGLKAESKDEEIKRLAKRQKAIEKFCHNSTATDETIQLLLIENKQLTQLIINLSKSTTQPNDITVPENEGEKLMEALTTFKNHFKA